MDIRENGLFLSPMGDEEAAPKITVEAARRNTITDRILSSHNTGDVRNLRLHADALVSPDNNYVSILQTAIASGIEHFPIPYVLTNCHNSLCAVGGTVNEDDHVFGLDCARKYGGIFVPAYRAVLHQYMREMMAGCGKLILGSDSHTRYGALGTLGIGEGGGEVVKQLMGQSYDLAYPQIVAIVLTGTPRPGIGPMDIALTLIGGAAEKSLLKNKILEVMGPGVGSLSMDMRMGIDVMTTESGALSSVWITDDKTRQYLSEHGREDDYERLEPAGCAYYDACIRLDLGTVEPMMALPYSPENVISIREFLNDPREHLGQIEEEGNRIKGSGAAAFSIMDKFRGGEFYADQALITGCSGGLFENIAAAADILDGHVTDPAAMPLGINPASQPIQAEIIRQGIMNRLTASGALLKPPMCGGCFGAGDTPANNSVSLRHVTRNYPNREGSKPGQGQMACTILMDARSIAATAANGGRFTSAMDMPISFTGYEYHFDRHIYETQVCDHRDKAQADLTVRMGPSIKPWPVIPALRRHLLVKAVGCYEGTLTTDELIPSGDATAYRSNPIKLADFTLISKDPGYRERARLVLAESQRHEAGMDMEADAGTGTERDARTNTTVGMAAGDGAGVTAGTAAEVPTGDISAEAADMLRCAAGLAECGESEVSIGTIIVGEQLGAGSSREQAVSCQRVLGGWANLAGGYSTKRYRSNCINWGILPLETCEDVLKAVRLGDWLFIPDVEKLLKAASESYGAYEIVNLTSGRRIGVYVSQLTQEEKDIILQGCLLNHYRGAMRQ